MPRPESSPAALASRFTFDAELCVIHLDLVGLCLDPAAIDEMMDACEDYIRTSARPPYILANWKSTSMSLAAAERYKVRALPLRTAIAAIFRYNVGDTFARLMVRTFTMNAHAKDANIYASKEEALAVIRERHRDTLQRSMRR